MFKPFPFIASGRTDPYSDTEWDQAWTVRSERRILPSSLLTLASHTSARTRRLGAAPFFTQYRGARNEYGESLHPICGLEKYRTRTSQGVPNGPDLHLASNNTNTYDYKFIPNANPLLGGLIHTTKNDVITGGEADTAFPGIGDPANSKLSRSHANKKKPDGSTFDPIQRAVVQIMALSGSVTTSWLISKIAPWLAQSDVKLIASGSSGFNAQVAIRSESASGATCSIQALATFTTGANLAPAPPLWGGGPIPYTAPYNAHILIRTRKNAPALWLAGSSVTEGETGEAIYRKTKETHELLNVVIERKWMDVYGTYDRQTPQAFEDLGYRRVTSFVGKPATLPASEQDRSVRFGFVSCDGRNYRLTLQNGKDPADPEDPFIEDSTEEVDIEAGIMAEYTYGEYSESVTNTKLLKLEEVTVVDGVDEFTEIAITPGVISHKPTSVCRILVIEKERIGSRWGHAPFILSPDFDDLDKNTIDRFKLKRQVRELKM